MKNYDRYFRLKVAVNLEGLAEALYQNEKVEGLVLTKDYKTFDSFIEDLEFFNEHDPKMYKNISEVISQCVERHTLYRSESLINMLYGEIDLKYLIKCIGDYEDSHNHKIGWIFYQYIQSK